MKLDKQRPEQFIIYKKRNSVCKSFEKTGALFHCGIPAGPYRMPFTTSDSVLMIPGTWNLED